MPVFNSKSALVCGGTGIASLALCIVLICDEADPARGGPGGWEVASHLFGRNDFVVPGQMSGRHLCSASRVGKAQLP